MSEQFCSILTGSGNQCYTVFYVFLLLADDEIYTHIYFLLLTIYSS